MDALDSHLLRPSIVSIVFSLSQQDGVTEALGCPSDASSPAFGVVGAAWRAFCQAPSPAKAACQRQIVLQAASNVLKDQPATGCKQSLQADFSDTTFAELIQGGCIEACGALAAAAQQCLVAREYSHEELRLQQALAPTQSKPANEVENNSLIAFTSLRHTSLLGAPTAGVSGSLSPGSNMHRSEDVAGVFPGRFGSQGSMDSSIALDPRESGEHVFSFEGVEVHGMQISTASEVSLSPRLSMSHGELQEQNTARAAQIHLPDFNSFEGPDDLSGSLLPGDPTSLMSPKRPRRSSFHDPNEAAARWLSPEAVRVQSRIGHESPIPDRHEPASGRGAAGRPFLQQQQHCIDPDADAEHELEAIENTTADPVCRRIAFDSCEEQSPTPSVGAPPARVVLHPLPVDRSSSLSLRRRRQLPPICLKPAEGVFEQIDVTSDALMHTLPPGHVVPLSQAPPQGAAARPVKLPPIRATRRSSSHEEALEDGTHTLELVPRCDSDNAFTREQDEDDADLQGMLWDGPGNGIVRLPGMWAGMDVPGSISVSPNTTDSPCMSYGGNSPFSESGAPWENEPLVARLACQSSCSLTHSGSVKRLRSGEPAAAPPVPAPLCTVWSDAQQGEGAVPMGGGSTPVKCVVLRTHMLLVEQLAHSLGLVPVRELASPLPPMGHVVSQSDWEAIQQHGRTRQQAGDKHGLKQQSWSVSICGGPLQPTSSALPMGLSKLHASQAAGMDRRQVQKTW